MLMRDPGRSYVDDLRVVQDAEVSVLLLPRFADLDGPDENISAPNLDNALGGISK